MIVLLLLSELEIPSSSAADFSLYKVFVNFFLELRKQTTYPQHCMNFRCSAVPSCSEGCHRDCDLNRLATKNDFGNILTAQPSPPEVFDAASDCFYFGPFICDKDIDDNSLEHCKFVEHLTRVLVVATSLRAGVHSKVAFVSDVRTETKAVTTGIQGLLEITGMQLQIPIKPHQL